MLESTIQLNGRVFRSISDVRGEHIRQDTLSTPLTKSTLTSRFSEDVKTATIRNNLLVVGFANAVAGAPAGTPVKPKFQVSLTLSTSMYHEPNDLAGEVAKAVGVLLAYLSGQHANGATTLMHNDGGEAPVANDLLAAIRRGEQ